MNQSETARYRGWNITINCLKHSNSDPRAPLCYTGRAFAVLDQSTYAGYWRDPQPQTTSIVNRVFASSQACAQALGIQIRTLIDSQKPAPADSHRQTRP